jgi:hypothetical protein
LSLIVCAIPEGSDWESEWGWALVASTNSVECKLATLGEQQQQQQPQQQQLSSSSGGLIFTIAAKVGQSSK